MVLYIYDLLQKIDHQREHVEQYHKKLAFTNAFVYSVNQAQSEANRFVVSKKAIHLRSFRLETVKVEQMLDSLEVNAGRTSYDSILRDISVLLRKKGDIVFALNKLFDNQNPIDSINEKLQDLDASMLQQDTVQVTKTTTIKDTVINTVPSKKGFWKRLSDVFSSSKKVDTIVTVSTLKIDTVKLFPETKRNVISEMSGLTEQAIATYSSQISAIEQQVNHLILTDQEISIQISTLLNRLSGQAINSTLQEVQRSEYLVRKHYNLLVVTGGIFLLLILVFIILIISDANKGHAARKALETANERTKQVMESRHQLLLSVSHDIKTPLGSILGYLELWQNGGAVSQQQMASMQNSGRHILALLENLLEFSSLEQGTLVVSASNFNLRELCSETAEMFIPLALQKRLSFDCNFDIGKDVELNSDALKIKQIIINILSNSVKYTLDGGIWFKAAYDDEQIRFVISDTGAGIPADQTNVLFKPFARVEKNNTLASGSGLGMYVVKRLVEMLQGTVQVSSVVGEGTRVEVTIPAKIVPEKSTHAITSKNVLLIDDDPALLAMLSDMLVKLGHSARICNNPTTFDRQEGSIEKYDLIITDMEMGTLSGTDVLKKIRSMGNKTTVIVMTGRGDFNEIKAIEAGFDGYLPKPVTMYSLRRLTGCIDHSTNEFMSLEEMFDGDREAIVEILEVFIRSTTGNIDTLLNMIVQNDFRGAQALCHKMLPMFMQVGAVDCIEFLKKMDAARLEGEEQHPFWRGKCSDFINHAEKLIAKIRKDYFGD